MKFKVAVFSTLVVLVLAQAAGAQETQWIRQFGTWDFDQPFGLALDTSGVYVAGSTFATLPGQLSAGGEDAFVRKYNLNGTELWTRQFGTPSGDHARAVAVDATGAYVVGLTGGTLPGQTSAGSADAFVRKYDLDGNEIWTRQFGTVSGDIAWAISVDASGAYVTGWTPGTLPGQVSAGGQDDAFVRKYDADGNEVWTRQFGTSSPDQALAISAGASGVYVAGITGGMLPGQTSAGAFDAFVRKYDLDGKELWTRQFGTASFDEPRGISVDASGAYVTGWTQGALPGQVSAGGPDAFLRKYDPNGTERWTQQFGTALFDQELGVAVDLRGVHVIGRTLGTLPGQTSAGAFDSFLRKHDFNGTEERTRQFGTAGDEFPRGVAVDATGIYVAGSTFGTFPGQVNAGTMDVFVVKFSQLTPQQALQELIADVVALNLQQGITNSLDAKLDAVVEALDDLNENNNVAAINALQAFINAVEAQRGIHIPEAEADALIAKAQQAVALLSGS